MLDTNGEEDLPEIERKPFNLLSAEEVNCMKGAVAPTRKLYARECFKTIRYPEGKLFEDEFVTYRILFSEKSIAYVDEPIYSYFLREGSLMHSRWNPRYLDAIDAYKEQIAFFEQNGLLKSQKRSVMNMTNSIIIQFHDASRCDAHEQIRILRREMRALILKYGKRGYGWISFKDNQGAYEVLYPRLMWVYWVCESRISRFLKKKGKG